MNHRGADFENIKGECVAMTTNAQKIVDDALRLDPGTRELIAETLLESLDLGADGEVSDEWRAEIRRRCAEIDQGTVKPIPGDRVRDYLRAKYGQ
jgi:putative addiction module component (TIGR02574 family)